MLHHLDPIRVKLEGQHNSDETTVVFDCTHWYQPLCETMTSSTKPEVHNELHCYQDQAAATGNMCGKFREI